MGQCGDDGSAAPTGWPHRQPTHRLTRCLLVRPVLRSTFVRQRLPIDAWRIMSAKQRGKAAAACFKLAQSTSTASDGGMKVPNMPGGGKNHIS